MTTVQPYSGFSSNLAPRETRRADRTLARQSISRDLRQGDIDVETDVGIVKAQGGTMVTGAAMQGVGQVANLQASLEAMAPQASGRLSLLADDHVFGMVEVTQEARRRMRRL